MFIVVVRFADYSAILAHNQTFLHNNLIGLILSIFRGNSLSEISPKVSSHLRLLN